MNNFEIVLTKHNKGILVANSVEVAKNLGVNHRDLLKKIDGYVEKFKEINKSEGVATSFAYLDFYVPSKYVHLQNKQEYRNYLITEKGIAQLIGGYSSAVPKAFDLNVAYINEFERMKNELNNTVSKKELLLVNVINAKNELEIALALNKYENEYVRPLETNLNETTKKLEHKQEVIDTMVEDVKLKTQRQFLVEIIKMKPKHIKERWTMLYKAYEHNKHINLNARYEGYNLINSPKLKSKLEYIDKVANDIPFLYGLAVKMFECDFKDKLQKYIEVL